MAALTPPFLSTAGLVDWVPAAAPIPAPPTPLAAPPPPDPIKLALPSIYTAKEDGLRVIRAVTTTNLATFLQHDLDLSNINSIHKHLWFAGLPQPPRSLHRQLQVGRTITVAEAADMHLLWHRSQIYLKPLPDFLLCHHVWSNYICPDPALYQSAIGLLLSYISLIAHPSDHRIATEHGLLNSNITWQQWTNFTKALVSGAILRPTVPKNPRFFFGELRLGRIILICRFCSVGKRQPRSLLRYYSYESDTYTSYFRKNLDWLLPLFIYITIVLTAMQVGLGTTHLNGKKAFQDASWGFTVFSIIGPLAIVSAVALHTVVLIVVNYTFTKTKKGKPALNDACWQQQSMDQYKH